MMATTPAGFKVILNGTYNRVGYGIKTKGIEYCDARQCPGEAEHLVVNNTKVAKDAFLTPSAS